MKHATITLELGLPDEATDDDARALGELVERLAVQPEPEPGELPADGFKPVGRLVDVQVLDVGPYDRPASDLGELTRAASDLIGNRLGKRPFVVTINLAHVEPIVEDDTVIGVTVGAANTAIRGHMPDRFEGIVDRMGVDIAIALTTRYALEHGLIGLGGPPPPAGDETGGGE